MPPPHPSRTASDPSLPHLARDAAGTRPAERFCRYLLPLFLWMTLIFIMSTGLGASANTAPLLTRLLHALRLDAVLNLTATRLDLLNYLFRKAAHVTEYAVLTMLAVRAFQSGKPDWHPRSGVGAVSLSLIYAGTDEWHQRFVPGRTAAVGDVGIDAIGVTVALICCWLWYHRALLRSGGGVGC